MWGNNDGPELRAAAARGRAVSRSTASGSRWCTRPAQAAGRERRCAAAYPDVDVLVFGHSHIPWDTTAPGGLRLLNPGSPTDRRRQPTHTWMTAEVHDGALVGATLHHLPR